MITHAKDELNTVKAISILEEFISPERKNRFYEVLSRRSEAITVVLERTHHNHNISAIIRSADAFGVQTIHFVGTKLDISKPISLGAERWIDIVHHETPTECQALLREQGYTLVVFKPPRLDCECKNSISVLDLPVRKKLALIYGNEKEGISSDFSNDADIEAFIPMLGFAESFNVSVTVGISLFAATSALQKVNEGLTSLPTERKNEILLSWLMSEVRGADKILKRHQIPR